MQDLRSRITVVGERQRVDVAVPSAAPIGQYVVGLAKLCGQERNDLLPAAWSLAQSAAPAMSLSSSLADAGVVDGEVLYLRDIVRDPDDVQVVHDVDEMVIEEAERLRDRTVGRGELATAVGLVWCVGAALLLGWHSNRAGAAIALALTGFLLLGLGWALEQRRVAMPRPLYLAIALCAAPCFAATGSILAQAAAGAEFRWAGATVGANIAVILALAASPMVSVLAVELELAAAAPVALVLVGVRANLAQAAAAIALLSLAFVVAARPLAAAVAVLSRGRSRAGVTQADEASRLLARTRDLTLVLLALPGLALATTLPVLTLSRQPFAVALGILLSIGLLARAAQAVVRMETVALSAAAVAGLFGGAAALAREPYAARYDGWLLAGVGLITVAVGVLSCLMRDPAAGQDLEPSAPRRRRPLDLAGTACIALSGPVALGAFGVLGTLLDNGRQMFG